jgi:hypothetical protein
MILLPVWRGPRRCPAQYAVAAEQVKDGKHRMNCMQLVNNDDSIVHS